MVESLHVPYLPSRHTLIQTRRWFRSSEAAIIVLALGLGICAGVMTLALQVVAHGLQHLFYGVGINRLSALESIRHPAKLLFLPLGGCLLALLYRFNRRQTSPLPVPD